MKPRQSPNKGVRPTPSHVSMSDQCVDHPNLYIEFGTEY